MADGVVRVEPLTADRWDDAVAVFGTRGDPSFCWCQFFRLPGASWRQSTRDANRDGLRAQAVEGPPPGLLAYLDDQPVGWLALAPRPAYARLLGSPSLVKVAGADLDDATVWSVTCFVVRVGQRGKGVASALLSAAPDFARAHGASVLEAHPVDVSSAGKKSNAELYHGVASTFVAAGYREIGRTGPTRPVMRLVL